MFRPTKAEFLRQGQAIIYNSSTSKHAQTLHRRLIEQSYFCSSKTVVYFALYAITISEQILQEYDKGFVAVNVHSYYKDVKFCMSQVKKVWQDHNKWKGDGGREKERYIIIFLEVTRNTFAT